MDKKVFDKKKFDDYYKSIPFQEQKRVREEFLKASELSYPSWFTKRQRGSFTALEIGALKKITGINFAM